MIVPTGQNALLWSNWLTKTGMIDLQIIISWISLFPILGSLGSIFFSYDQFRLEKYVKETAEMLIRCSTLWFLASGLCIYCSTMFHKRLQFEIVLCF